MKEITISEKSIFAKLYQFVYRTDLPKGLCNFFWANLIALIFLIPYFIYILPILIINSIAERKSETPFLKRWVREFEEEFWQLMGISVVGWIGIFLVYAYGYGIYYMATMCTYFEEATAIFWIINCIAIAIGIAIFWNNVINPWWSNFNSERELKRAEAWYLSLGKGELTEDYKNTGLLDDYKCRGSYEEKEPTTWWTTIIWTAIKGFYDKNCPVITWK